jgi:hypothetical protein
VVATLVRLAALVRLTARIGLAARVLVDWREEVLDVLEEATGREEVTTARAFGLLLSLALVAAASGEVHSSTAEANKTVVLILISDRIKHTPPKEMETNPVVHQDPAG